MTEVTPHPKPDPRKPARTFRKKATAAQWLVIRAEKVGPCRVCLDPAMNGRLYGLIEYHHLLSRARGGDDVAENICPLCPLCHGLVSGEDAASLAALAASLQDNERAYLIGKCGPGYSERLFGVES